MAEFYIGEIRLFAFDQYAPANFLPCDGRALKVTDYQALFSLIGTTYGGDGVTNFNLPDLRGRTPVNFGQLIGGTNYALAQKAGTEAAPVTASMVPPHNHIVSVTKFPATATIPTADNVHGDVGGDLLYCDEAQTGALFQTVAQTVSTDGGANLAHPNIQPSLVLSYAIAVYGLYPDVSN